MYARFYESLKKKGGGAKRSRPYPQGPKRKRCEKRYALTNTMLRRMAQLILDVSLEASAEN